MAPFQLASAPRHPVRNRQLTFTIFNLLFGFGVLTPASN
jgi:hypothetical protein